MKTELSEKQRKRNRTLVNLPVVLDGKIEAVAIDLSATGMYLHTTAVLKNDQMTSLRFELPDGAVSAKGRVTHIHPGIGAGFRFEFMTVQDTGRIQDYLVSLEKASAIPASSGRKKILIIDDTDFYKTAYQAGLAAEGYSVILAKNGAEGIRLATQEKPSLVVLDLVMDGMDGYTVLRILKSQVATAGIPVLVASVKGSTEERRRVRELGAIDCLVKSTTPPAKLIARIKTVFKNSSR